MAAEQRTFTLLELLVAAAIIGVLIALLLPALGSAREQASAIVCKDNLRQIYEGIFSYTLTYGMTHPKVHGPPNPTMDCWAWWPVWYTPYIYSGRQMLPGPHPFTVFYCPSDWVNPGGWIPSSFWHDEPAMGQSLESEVPFELLREEWDRKNPDPARAYHNGQRNFLWSDGRVK